MFMMNRITIRFIVSLIVLLPAFHSCRHAGAVTPVEEKEFSFLKIDIEDSNNISWCYVDYGWEIR